MAVCAHCLLEVPEESATRETIDGKETTFCCPGCRSIHGILRSEGLTGFYARRHGWTPGPPESARVPLDAFDGAVRTSGRQAEADLVLSGIRCASCVWLIERYLGGRPGILSARVNFATGRARISWDPSETGIGDVVLAIRALGYTPYPPESLPDGDALRRETSDLLLRFGTAAFLSMQVMLFTAGLYAGYFQGIDARYAQLFRWLCFLLSTPVVFYSGAPFFLGALRGARHGAFGMDALVFLGAFSAYGYSTASLFLGGEVYFDTATMILTLILLGRYIEAGARSRAADGISRLVRLAPVTARKAVPGGGTIDVPVASLSPGDLVEIVPGERMPADGNVVEGNSEADESMLTGESAPVPKTAGDPVVAGSLNGTGRLLVRVVRTGGETVLSRVVQAVEEAQARKAPIQRAADRVVRFFVPAILLVAAGTVLLGLHGGSLPHAALMAGISVLVDRLPVRARTGDAARRPRRNHLRAGARDPGPRGGRSRTGGRGAVRPVRQDGDAHPRPPPADRRGGDRDRTRGRPPARRIPRGVLGARDRTRDRGGASRRAAPSGPRGSARTRGKGSRGRSTACATCWAARNSSSGSGSPWTGRPPGRTRRFRRS